MYVCIIGKDSRNNSQTACRTRCKEACTMATNISMIDKITWCILSNDLERLLISIVWLLPAKDINTLIEDFSKKKFERGSLSWVVCKAKFQATLKQCPISSIIVKTGVVNDVCFFIIPSEWRFTREHQVSQASKAIYFACLWVFTFSCIFFSIPPGGLAFQIVTFFYALLTYRAT